MHIPGVLVLCILIGTSSCLDDDIDICYWFPCFNYGEAESLDGECACVCPGNTSGSVCQFDTEQSDWPDGPYSLPAPKTGCAEDHTRGWRPGYIELRLQQTGTGTMSTADAPDWPIRVDHALFRLTFCTKLEGEPESGVADWATGHYGVLMSGETCPPGFLQRDFSFPVPDFWSWSSDGELPNFELTPSNHSITMTACMRDAHDNGTETPPWSNSVYLLKNPESECPAFDGFEVTEEDVIAKSTADDGGATYSLCHVRPFRSVEPVYSFDDWEDLGLIPTCLEAFGMDSNYTVENNQLSASSYEDHLGRPRWGRPGKNGGWCPTWAFDSVKYFQIDLLTPMMIEAIEVHHTKYSDVGNLTLSGENDTLNISTRFSISYAMDKLKQWQHIDQVLTIQKSSLFFWVPELLLFRPITARIVRIYILAYTMCLRFELIGCKNDVELSFKEWIDSAFPATCLQNLDLTNGAIEEFQITSSSWEPGYEPEKARPGMSGWCPDPNDNNAYIQVDLLLPVYIEGVKIFGFPSINVAIKRLCNEPIEYAQYRTIMFTYASEDMEFRAYKSQIFSISAVNDTEVFLLKPFIARFLRIHIVHATNEYARCLKFELIGCKRKGSLSTTCSKDRPNLWIDNPIFLPGTAPEDLSMLNLTSVESCQQACQQMMDNCSTVRYVHGGGCLIYSMSDAHRDQVLLPTDDGAIWRTLVCWTEKGVKTYLRIEQRQVIVSSGYPFQYAPDKEAIWTIIGDPQVEVTFTNISLHPPGNEDCVETIQIYVSPMKYPDAPFPAITYEYNDSILYVPSQYSHLHIKFSSCPRVCIIKQRYHGFRAVVDLYIGPDPVWPQRDALDTLLQTLMTLTTFNLLGHPSHTLSKDIWRVRLHRRFKIETVFFNVPCDKGHQLNIIDKRDRYRVCNPNKPSWPYESDSLIIEYVYGAPAYAVGFSAVTQPAEYMLLFDLMPPYCQFPWFHCSDVPKKCVPPEMVCDGVPYCEDDESEFACQHYLPKACSRTLHKCFAVQEVLGYTTADTGYWKHRNYSRDCADLDGDYTLPIIRNRETMERVRSMLTYTCHGEPLVGCDERIFIDIEYEHLFDIDANTIPIREYDHLFDIDANTIPITGILYPHSNRSSSKGNSFLTHECVSGEMTHIAAVCDGIADCSDGSDELACNGLDEDGCTFEEFECGNGTCIGLHKVCDYIQDCFPDGKDEFCDFPDCDIGEFQCQNKQCVPNYVRCDAIKDCEDGTDETLCEFCNETNAYPCEDLTCIHKAFVCDGINTCKFGRDENNCDSSFSTCFQWWQAGYRKNGTYLLDDVLEVRCIFLAVTDITVIVLTELDIEVYDHERGFELHLGSLAPYVQITKDHMYQADDATCRMKIEIKCTPNILQLEKYEELGADGSFQLCSQQTLDFKFEWESYPVTAVTSSGIRLASSESEFRPDILIIQPQQMITQYSMTEFGSVRCSKEYNATDRTIACGDGTTAALATHCVYDVGQAGNIIGCQTFEHLADCKEFECPAGGYVKCPDDFCIPERLVCDGLKQCRNGEDELDCSCKEKEGRLSIVYSGEASEAKRSYIYKFARLLISMTLDVRVVSLTVKGTEVLVKTRLVHHSNEALNQQEWKQHTVSHTGVAGIIDEATIGSSSHDIIVIFDESFSGDMDDDMKEISSKRESQTKVFHVYLKSDMRRSVTKSSGANATHIFVKSWDILGSAGSTLIDKCQENHTARCAGKFKCMSSRVCIPLRQVCDGVPQCLFEDDERLCDFFCPVTCSCGSYAINCSAADLNTSDLHTLPTTVRSLDLSYCNSFTFEENKLSFPDSFTALVRLNVSSCRIAAISDNAFEKTKSLLELDLSYNELKLIKRKTFTGLRNLETLILTGNSDIESIESSAFHDLLSIRSLTIVSTRLQELFPETFFGLQLNSLDISNNKIRKVWDMAFSGLDVDTLVIDGNDVRDFGRDIFTDMRNVRTIISPAFKFCCYRPDYVEENNCFPSKDEFSSCEDLMRNSGLQTLLWVVGVSATVGNILSIVYRLTIDRVRLKLGFGVFVTNLAISDLLMGIYLLIIAVADLNFRKRYIEVEAEWKSSFFCKLAGVLATVSSEASVVFMCLITLDRILVIKFPFGRIRFRTKSAMLFTLAGWALAWIIALFPLLYSDLFEGQFYSKSGVCLALPLTRNRAPGWLYSVFIFVGFNFVTFIMIAIGQLIIYLEIKESSKRMAKQTSSRRKDMIVARNLFLVLTTDFLCWFPIGVMAIMALTGYAISGDVYAWTAVTVLPINSALNPILYTVTAVLRRKQFNPRTGEQAGRKTVDQSFMRRLIMSRQIFNVPDHLVSIEKLLSDQWSPTPKFTVLVAVSIIKSLHKIHVCHFLHGTLRPENVYVESTTHPEAFIKATLRRYKSNSETRKDIYDFGKVLKQMCAAYRRLDG